MKDLSLEWLIQGHISKEEAIFLAKQNSEIICESNNKRIQKQGTPSIKLNEKTVYNITSTNQDSNPNNAVLVAYYFCRQTD